MKDRIKQQEVDEQIKKALLLIKYDSSKTLTENEELSKTVNEDSTVGGAAAIAGASGAAIGAGAGAAWPSPLRTERWPRRRPAPRNAGQRRRPR
jgi:hypothetical protein